MKIYLPTLTDLLKQCTQKVYVMVITETKGDYVDHSITVTSFNDNMQVLEFRHTFSSMLQIFTTETKMGKIAFEKGQKLEGIAIQDIKKAGFTYLPGYINDKPIDGKPLNNQS